MDNDIILTICKENQRNFNKIFKKRFPIIYSKILNYWGITFGQKCYNLVYNLKNNPKCTFCGVNDVSFVSFHVGYRKFCSTKCSSSDDVVKKKKEKTCIKKYGVIHQSLSENVKQKIQETSIKKYGVRQHMKNKTQHEKQKQTLLKNYGVLFPLQSKTIRNKMEETMKRKYGVLYAMQNPDSFYINQMNGFRFKPYVTPLGKTLYYQGYENIVLDHLLIELKYSEDELIIGQCSVPSIKYFDSKDNKTRYFFPDIFIEKHNKLIEVKSIFTFKKYENKNRDKIKAAVYLGYDIKFYICDDTKILEII